MNKTKKAIFESGIKIFSIYGYNGATMDEVAKNAGVAKGTLYYHFKSKEEIFEYIITEGIKLMKEQVKTLVDKEKDYVSKLMVLCKIELTFIYENRDFFKVVMSQLWGEEIRNLHLRDVIREYIDWIESILKEAMEAGVIKKIDTSFTAYMIFGTLCSVEIYELINKDFNNLDKALDKLMVYILSGIEKK